MDRAVAQSRIARAQAETDAGAGPAPASGVASRLTLRIPADSGRLRAMRRRVEAWADEHGFGEQDQIDLQLALGEAVSNGMEHAYPADAAEATVEIELSLLASPGEDEELTSRALAARVRDRGRWRPARAKPSTRGRGLAMIEALATELRVTSNAHGTEVSFTLPLRH